MKFFLFFITLKTCVLSSVPNFGVFGQTFPVLEKNIIHVLQEKMASDKGRALLSHLEKSYLKMREEKKYVPQKVLGLMPTIEQRSYMFDPSLFLTHDIADHNGNVFYKKGTSLNPLTVMTLSKEYVFIDGTRDKQIEWSKKMMAEKNIMIILVDGDPMRIMKDHHITVFFDQDGEMVKRFELTHVPCVMRQEGQKLQITEIPEKDMDV